MTVLISDEFPGFKMECVRPRDLGGVGTEL